MRTKIFFHQIVNTLVLAVWVIGVNCAVASSNSESFGWKFEYDKGDRIVKVTDPAGRDTRIEYIFDETNQHLRERVKTTADGARVSHEFDASGRLLRMTDGAGSESYRYDERGRLNNIERQGAAKIAYTYDSQDRISSLQVGDFYRIGYTYDFLGRLAAMKTPVGVIEYEYLTGQGKVIRKLPNGIWSIHSYAPNGELQNIQHGKVSDVTQKGYSLAPMADYTYQYRPDGLISTIGEGNNNGKFSAVSRYQYDTVGRLISAVGPNGQKYSYEYDLVGNRLKAVSSGKPEQTASYDWAGRMILLDDNESTHDAAGNLTAVTLGGEAINYRYTPDNHLAEVGDGKVSYRYDGEGCLMSRKTGGVETQFILDPLSPYWQPLVIESNGSSRTLVVWEGAIPLMLIKDGKPEYLLHDHLGSVRLATDGKGQLTQRFDYEPFGSLLNSTSSTEFAPRFAGLFWDAEAKAYLTLARGYRPDLGQFIGVEPQRRLPFGEQKDFSVYGYSGDDPVNFVDRNGAERTTAEIKQEINDKLDDINQRQENMRYKLSDMHQQPAGKQRELRDKQIEMLDRLRQQFQGVGVRQLHQVERFRNDYLYISTLNMAVSSMNAGMIGASLIGGGIDFAAITGAAGGFQEYFIDEINKTNQVAGKGVKAPMDVAGEISNINDITKLFFDAGKILINPRIITNTNIINRVFKEGADFPLSPKSYLEPVGREFSHTWLSPISIEESFIKTQKVTPRIHDINYELSKFGTEKAFENYAEHGIAALLSHVGGGYVGGLANSYSEPSTTSSAGDKYTKPLPSNLPVIEKPVFHPFEDREDRIKKPPTISQSQFPPPPGQPPTPSLGSAGNQSTGGGNGWNDHPPLGGGSVPVGGINLGGTGQLLQGFGTLEGVSKDANGNLILIGKSGADIKLPPLRLDDVVTVFRSVYLNGEGPTVTIDPSPINPEESAMIIRHSAATDKTYVGWVLYEADRLMKGYNLGKDNITAQDIQSIVPGYKNVLDTIYFGGGQFGSVQNGGNWERFWIVPAAARRYEADQSELTLFDVPLKVRTQPMKWEKGKLVDDAKRNPTKGAAVFTEWFTSNYEGIAHEQYLLPPPESGIAEKVPVFTELQRIALLTALAEKLRDQGVSLPFWMRDYEIRQVSFEKITPAMQITRTNERIKARIFGGVSLSPPNSDVKIFTKTSGVSTLPKKDQAAAQKTLDRSASLSLLVQKEMAAVEPLQVRTFTHQGETQQATVLPGADTLSLAPVKLDEPDISVFVEGGKGIQLLRSYNSFFNPSGPWGKGWAMDLPRLEEAKVPVKRDAMGGVTYRIDHELISPFNSVSARFSKIAAVPELNGSRLYVPDKASKASEFLGMDSENPDFLTNPTQILIKRNGEKWHFNQAGDLVATEHGGFRTVYERDAAGRLTRILGVQGKQLAASIQLSYDNAGRLQTATGQRETGETVNEKDKATVNYEYDASGTLIAVSTNDGRSGYQYKDSLLVAVTNREQGKNGKEFEDKVVRSFEYNSHGQLLAETDARGVKSKYRVTSDEKGKTLTVVSEGSKTSEESIQYDSAFRPVEAQYAKGIKASWQYPDGGGSIMVIASAEGEKITLTESADHRKKTLELDKQRKLVGEYDTAGRLTSLVYNGIPVLRQEWASDGNLRLATNEKTSFHPSYDDDGQVSSVLIAPPDEPNKKGEFKYFQKTTLDASGRPLKITDNSGLYMEMDYFKTGELRAMINKRDGQNFGINVNRDDQGRIKDVDSPRGKQTYAYDAAGLVNKIIVVETQGSQASIELKEGFVQKVRQFDGGEYSFNYDTKAYKLKNINTPNGLQLQYNYTNGQIEEVKVGKLYKLKLDYDKEERVVAWNYSSAK